MKIGELIKKLSSYDENMEVELQYQDDGGWYEGSVSCEEIYVKHKPYGDIIILG